VGCGRIAPKRELLRFALAPGQPLGARTAVPDVDARLGGRGAYLCREPAGSGPREACLAAAVRRNGFARTLRTKVTVDPKLVESVGR